MKKDIEEQLIKDIAMIKADFYGTDNEMGTHQMVKEMYNIIVVTKGMATFIKWLSALGTGYLILKGIGINIFK